jgi:hypothetical protein
MRPLFRNAKGMKINNFSIACLKLPLFFTFKKHPLYPRPKKNATKCCKLMTSKRIIKIRIHLYFIWIFLWKMSKNTCVPPSWISLSWSWYPVERSIGDFKNYCPLLTSYYTLKLVEKSTFFIALIFFVLNFGNYRYLPVFSIEVLGITGITVFEKVGIFAIPNSTRWLLESAKWLLNPTR